MVRKVLHLPCFHHPVSLLLAFWGYSNNGLIRQCLSLCMQLLNGRVLRAAARRADDFANSSAGGSFVTSSGAWLSNPVGVLKAFDASGNATSALLTLADPRYDAATHTLSFKVLLLFSVQQMWGDIGVAVEAALYSRMALDCTALYHTDKCRKGTVCMQCRWLLRSTLARCQHACTA